MNPRAEPRAFRSLRIIVANGQQGETDLCATILPRMGHKLVHIAGTGRELIEKCRELQPNLVISDFQLPDMGAAALDLWRRPTQLAIRFQST